MGCSSSCVNVRISPFSMSSVQLQQFAKEVVHFSSQYGGDGTMAYVVTNLAGPPSIFPNYGDFTQACVFRTYGTWWDMAPSGCKHFGKRDNGFRGKDFVDLYFEEKVYPLAINIYETYHPGAVIQICAAEIERVQDNVIEEDNVKWHELWSGESRQSKCQPQMFSPPIKKATSRTNLIRLVFDHSHSQYYTELDAVELIGTQGMQDDGTDIDEVYSKHIQKISLIDDKEDDIHKIPLETLPTTDNGFFDILPGELIQLIFSHLSLPDLCRTSLTCKLFKRHCYDQLQYVELDLQPYWRVISDEAFRGLTSRCSQLQKLSVSWCGDWGKISPEEFIRFLETCGNELKVLQFQACRFVTNEVIQTISNVCLKLEELNLASCRAIGSSAFHCIYSLQNLQKLNLYRTRITEAALISVLSNTPKLRHLNIGSIRTIGNYDNIIREVGLHCPMLETLDVWRAKTLTYHGIGCLAAGCPNLLELDLGWCSELQAGSNWVSNLVSNCTKLRKLFLTSIRSIADPDLYAIASHLADLEQLDILGTMRVGPQSVTRVLDKCPKLKFLDVSFCQQLNIDVVSQLMDKYPNVSIKKSFTM